jgi:hypothetical protein
MHFLTKAKGQAVRGWGSVQGQQLVQDGLLV